MLKRAVQHPSQNFHVAMRMHAKALARRHVVLIDYAQRAKLHMLGVVVVGERKCEPAIEPSMLRMPALFTWSNLYHFASPSFDVARAILRRSGRASCRCDASFPAPLARGRSFLSG